MGNLSITVILEDNEELRTQGTTFKTTESGDLSIYGFNDTVDYAFAKGHWKRCFYTWR